MISLSIVERAVAGCTSCSLHENRTHSVFGAGHPSATLMFVGEAPGPDEDGMGEPFVGVSGRLARQNHRSNAAATADRSLPGPPHGKLPAGRRPPAEQDCRSTRAEDTSRPARLKSFSARRSRSGKSRQPERRFHSEPFSPSGTTQELVQTRRQTEDAPTSEGPCTGGWKIILIPTCHPAFLFAETATSRETPF